MSTFEMKYMASTLSKESITDRFKWFKELRDITISKYGGRLMATPYGNEGRTDYIEFGYIPSLVFTSEITDDYNGLTKYFWMRVWNFESEEVTEELLETYRDRLVCLLTYNDQGDYKGFEDKGKSGNNRTFILKMVC